MPIFYNNEANIVISEDEHYYESLKEPGVYYPSVTTKLNAYPKGYGFNEWIKSNGFNSEILLERAGNLGKEVHNAIEQFHLTGKLRQVSENLTKELFSWPAWVMINKFMNYNDRFKPDNIVNEFKIVSPKWKTGGTIDEICMLNNERWLIDYKTGNNIYNTHWIQICVYTAMWNELNPKYKIQHTGILHLKANIKTEKDGKIQGKGWQLIEPPKEFEHYINLWKYTSSLWDEENPNARPKRVQYPIEFSKNMKIDIEIIKEQLELINDIDGLKKYWNDDFKNDEKITNLFNERENQLKNNE